MGLGDDNDLADAKEGLASPLATHIVPSIQDENDAVAVSPPMTCAEDAEEGLTTTTTAKMENHALSLPPGQEAEDVVLESTLSSDELMAHSEEGAMDVSISRPLPPAAGTGEQTTEQLPEERPTGEDTTEQPLEGWDSFDLVRNRFVTPPGRQDVSDTLMTLCIDAFGQDGFPRGELAEGTNASYMATGYRGGERGMEEGGVVLNHVICKTNK